MHADDHPGLGLGLAEECAVARDRHPCRQAGSTALLERRPVMLPQGTPHSCSIMTRLSGSSRPAIPAHISQRIDSMPNSAPPRSRAASCSSSMPTGSDPGRGTREMSTAGQAAAAAWIKRNVRHTRLARGRERTASRRSECQDGMWPYHLCEIRHHGAWVPPLPMEDFANPRPMARTGDLRAPGPDRGRPGEGRRFRGGFRATCS